MLWLLWWLLARTRFGVLVRAATENRVMTAALGIDQACAVHAPCSRSARSLAGLAGALQLPREPANLGMDLSIIAEAFVVTVVGGLGSIPGAFVAALIIGLVKALCIGLGTRRASAGIHDRLSQADAGRRIRRDGDRAFASSRRVCSAAPAGSRRPPRSPSSVRSCARRGAQLRLLRSP